MATIFVTYPGIDTTLRGQYCRTLGVNPDTVTIHCLPQATPPSASGNVVFFDGTTTLTIPDCGVDYTRVHYSTQGHIGIVSLQDTRRRWQFGVISGHYNVMVGGELKNEKTPQELASLLLTAMGVSTFSVTALPNLARPEVNWIYSRADLALSALCHANGCEISLNLNNSVTIVRLGVGASLSMDDDAIGSGFTLDPPDIPETLRLVCGPSLWQSRLKCIAVGVDTDKSIKPIEDLSYKPSGGWADCVDDEHFATITDEAARNLAVRSVYRWYQIESQADGTQDLEGYEGDIDDSSQLLPLQNHALDTSTIATTSTEAENPATVYGTFILPGDPPSDRNCPPMTFYQDGFSIDRQRGIVKFSERVTKIEEDVGSPFLNTRVAADVFLETSYPVLDSGSQMFARQTYTYDLAGTLSGEAVLYESTLAARTTVLYENEDDPTEATGTTTNEEDLSDAAEAILTAAALQYTYDTSNSIPYRRLKAVNTDGAIRQVAWEVSCTNAALPVQTRISRNTETELGVPRSSVRKRRNSIESEKRPK